MSLHHDKKTFGKELLAKTEEILLKSTTQMIIANNMYMESDYSCYKQLRSLIVMDLN